MATAQPRSSDHSGPLPRLLLTGQLAGPVDRPGVGAVPLVVGLGLVAGEHIVGGDVAQVGVEPAGGFGQVAHRKGVDQISLVGVGLAGVHRGVGRAVDHCVGADPSDGTQHLIPAGDVQVLASRGDDLVARGGEPCRHVVAELPARAGDENSHGIPSLSGSHHQRLSRYQSTVAARASSNWRCGVHPKAVILAASTE